MRDVTLYGTGVERPGELPLLLLRERAGARRVLPLWVGTVEVEAVLAARGTAPAPVTDLLNSFERRLCRVRILLSRVGAVVAELVFDGDVRVAARPSEAVVLAILFDAPMQAADEVLDRMAVLRSELAAG